MTSIQNFYFMNTKSFLASSLGAFVVYYLLGALFYGFLFTDLYPTGGEENMVFIAVGCLFYALLLTYVLTVVSSVKSAAEGFKIGAIFGLLNALSMNFFMYASLEPNYENIAIDSLLSLVMVGITGAVVALIHKKLDS